MSSIFICVCGFKFNIILYFSGFHLFSSDLAGKLARNLAENYLLLEKGFKFGWHTKIHSIVRVEVTSELKVRNGYQG
jgi:hypothetical protein